MAAMTDAIAHRRRRSPLRRLLYVFVVLFIVPIAAAAGALATRGGPVHWRDYDRTIESRLLSAAKEPAARIMVMTGRTRGWKGAVATHSWVAFKRENEFRWHRYDVSGWGQSPVRLNWWPPDLWFGEYGHVVLDLRGERAQALIPRVEAAIKDYRWDNAGDYRIWPGPNSNTFIAAVLRAIPEAQATLPPDAIGRDYRPHAYAGMTDSGTGLEANLYGLAGLKVGWIEGIELNMGGFVAGLDVRRPALKLPGLGRIGWERITGPAVD